MGDLCVILTCNGKQNRGRLLLCLPLRVLPIVLGKMPIEDEGGERPRVRKRAEASTYVSINDLPFALLTQRIFSAERWEKSQKNSKQAGLIPTIRELIAARQTVSELEDALAAKDATISEMLRVSSDRFGSAGGGPSSVKRELVSPPGPPPEFGLPVEKD
ncbi:uncharacterized protein G2W53_039430 [Senna tora]|uniref:Uncharacterized protein n=1 Tax=Senna tora TaxID=362788 RepID=A0A834T1B5_9FABA|nr:uncharacterized protein G2W53_039430 [Senna tora]